MKFLESMCELKYLRTHSERLLACYYTKGNNVLRLSPLSYTCRRSGVKGYMTIGDSNHQYGSALSQDAASTLPPTWFN
jgi:hypothetical protein